MKNRNLLVKLAGIAASGFCLAAGLVLISKGKSDLLPFAIGLYFIGKAFFVGPLLIITASRS